jgi:Flp pilus assembly protein TadB
MITHPHPTAADTDRDYHRNLLLMAQQHERNATALAQDLDRMALALVTREGEMAEERRENARLRAQIAQAARKGPRWYSVALAALVCAPAWLVARVRRWPAPLLTALLTVAIIAAVRWLGGL